MRKRAARIEDGSSVLSRVVGARLTSVQFVLDYLILGFDGKGALTTLVWPEIFIAGTGSVLKYGMESYRDRLCDLITPNREEGTGPAAARPHSELASAPERRLAEQETEAGSLPLDCSSRPDGLPQPR